jgi:hypothetical protein
VLSSINRRGYLWTVGALVAAVSACGSASGHASRSLARTPLGQGVAVKGRVAAASRDPARCGPADDHTLLTRGSVRIYTWGQPKASQRHDAFACDSSTGVTSTLAAQTAIAFPPPAIAVNGTTVAYGEDILTALDNPDALYAETMIQVVSLARARPEAGLLSVFLAVPPTHFQEVKVVSVVVTAAGDAAWIACESSSYHQPDDEQRYRDFETGRAARCQHAGQQTWVLAAGPTTTANATPRIVDSGQKIGPLSLRLHGSRITWTDGGKTRSAAI